jgi:hypothetical protein
MERRLKLLTGKNIDNGQFLKQVESIAKHARIAGELASNLDCNQVY